VFTAAAALGWTEFEPSSVVSVPSMSNTTTSWPVAAASDDVDRAAEAAGVPANSAKATTTRSTGIRARRTGVAEQVMGDSLLGMR
jgi:hypothetical protein